MSSSSVTGCCQRRLTVSAISSGRWCWAALMGDGPCRRPTEPARRPLPAGARRQAGGVLRLEGLAVRQHPVSSVAPNAKGAVFHDFTPAARARRAAARRSTWAGKKVLSEDYLKALTPLSLAIWYMDDGSFTVRSKGLQAAHRGRQRPHRDLCRGDERGSRVASTRLSGRHLGLRRPARANGCTRQGGAGRSPRPRRPSSRHCRAVRPSVDGVQAAAAIPWAVRRRAGVR